MNTKSNMEENLPPLWIVSTDFGHTIVNTLADAEKLAEREFEHGDGAEIYEVKPLPLLQILQKAARHQRRSHQGSQGLAGGRDPQAHEGEEEVMSTPIKYPDVKVQLSGTDGNAFFIIGRVRSALRAAKVSKEEIEAFTTEAQSGDYDNVLQTCMRWVEVT